MDFILGRKLKQSQQYTSDGRRIPVTVIEAGPCTVVQVKTQATDNYDALQMGFGSRRIKTSTKAIIGHVKKAGLDKNPPRFLREFRIVGELTREDKDRLNPGTIIKIADVLTVGDVVDITGDSKGKGFAGAVKRYHFKGGPRTRGQSDRERAPGSIGQTTTPGRVYKGKKMAGRMGGTQVTVRNLQVVMVDPERNLLTIKGLIPGGMNGLVLVKKISA